jgi:glycosyltransferase involved in cell wall biosynthesis
MVIWYISKYASPQKYFFGTRHFYLAEEWVKSGHEVFVFTSNSNHLTDKLPVFTGKYFFEIIKGVKTYWLNTYKVKKGNSSSVKRILSWFHFEWQLMTLKKEKISKPDVVIISSLSLLTVLNGYWISKRYNCKFIFEVRDIWPLSLMELGGYTKFNPLIAFLSYIEKFGYKKANAIVGTMPNLKEHVENVIGKTDKCYAVPQGYSKEFYENQAQLDSDYIQKYIPKDKFIVAYAGTISINNPIDVLIEAARNLKDYPIAFVIIGEGNKKNELITSSNDLPNVIFAPSLPKNKVNHFLSFTSVCFDSFSSELAKYGLSRNKWIDYMYAGKPIICSYSGYKSMINESNSGSFVAYNNVKLLTKEIVKYYEMPSDELEKTGERAKDYIINNRGFKKLAADYVDLIKVIKK